jgi:inosose dehydratase
MTSPAISRRAFLQTAAAAPVLAAVGRAADPDQIGGYPLGVQSYTFRKFDLEQALKRMRDAGLTAVELFRGHLPTNASPDKIAAAKKLAADYGVTPVAFGVERFSSNHDNNKKTFEFAAALGVKFLSADPDPDSFDSLDKLVAEYNVAVAIHPHGPSGGKMHRWDSAETILKAVKDHDPRIGTCIDTGHLIRSAQLGRDFDPVQQVRVMGARNHGLHLKDHDNRRKTDVPFGDPAGSLDVAGVLKALKDVGFKGYISIEYEANPDEPTADLKKCVAYFRETVKKLG